MFDIRYDTAKTVHACSQHSWCTSKKHIATLSLSQLQ